MEVTVLILKKNHFVPGRTRNSRDNSLALTISSQELIIFKVLNEYIRLVLLVSLHIYPITFSARISNFVINIDADFIRHHRRPFLSLVS